MDGTDPFGGVDTISGDAGLLTLVHQIDRTVHKQGLKTLLCHVWVGGAPTEECLPSRPERPSFAEPFLKSLAWTTALKGLTDDKPVGKRAHVCAHMLLVLVSLFCRIRHLHALISNGDAKTFHQLLYAGICSTEVALQQNELKFLDEVLCCTPRDAKQIIAFWQAGICGLHSYDIIRDNLVRLGKNKCTFDWLKKVIFEGEFQIDRDWLLNRSFLVDYRRHDAELPVWILPTDSGNGLIKTSIGHLCPLNWIIPRTRDEDVAVLGISEPVPESIVTDDIRAIWAIGEKIMNPDQPNPLLPDAGSIESSHVSGPFSVLDETTQRCDREIQGDVATLDIWDTQDAVSAIFEPSNQARLLENFAAAMSDNLIVQDDAQSVTEVF